MRRALVTGASRGIGKAVADELKNRGYEVYAPTHAELDLADAASIERYLGKTAGITFDVAVNNAGRNDINEIDLVKEEDLTNMINLNLAAPIRLLKGVVPNMKKQKFGRIVNIGSIWGIVSKPGRVVYSATKHGVHGITQTLAVELAPFNILVNTVNPGFTLTEMTYQNNTPEQIADISSFIPLGRMAKPEEIAKVVCYLLSDENTYLTGQNLTVDGGYTAK